MEKTKFKKGFTLIEIIVSLGIFTVVALVAVGALLKIIDANKKSQSLETAINNVNFALEDMSRDLRSGGHYYCYQGNSFKLSDVYDDSPDGTYLVPSTSATCSSYNLPLTLVFNSAKRYLISGDNYCNLIHAYRFELDSGRGTIKKAEQKTCTDNISSSADLSTYNEPWPFVPVISPDVDITGVSLDVYTGDSANIGQPRIRLFLKGYSGVKEKNKTYFDIQTTISQRIND